jgi:SAM-dependent methyltransferase
MKTIRTRSFGQDHSLTRLDRLGVLLSGYRVRAELGSLEGKRLGDFGCGFNAQFVRQVLPSLKSATVVDVALSPDVLSDPRVQAIEGVLPKSLAALPNGSLDVVVCISVLEHLTAPELALSEFRRVLAPGGVCLLNVPSWWGKTALEFSAFRLGLSPPEEMDDHKRYYDPRDLWPMLVAAGFLPHQIKCRRHKAGLNTFAVCRLD